MNKREKLIKNKKYINKCTNQVKTISKAEKSNFQESAVKGFEEK